MIILNLQFTIWNCKGGSKMDFETPQPSYPCLHRKTCRRTYSVDSGRGFKLIVVIIGFRVRFPILANLEHRRGLYETKIEGKLREIKK